MNTILQAPAARPAPAAGIVAGALMIFSASMLSASSSDVELTSPAGAAIAKAETGLVQLAQADAVPVERPVSYSSDQADRGEDRYERDCQECHGDDLKGGLNGGAPLRGMGFEQKFAEGAPASALFGFMSTMMPPNSPGRYSANTYADLMAYVLKRNGFHDGAPLPSDLDALDALIMQK